MFNFLKIQRLAILTLVFLIISFSFSTIFIALAGDSSAGPGEFDEKEREPFEYKLMVPLPTASGTVATTTGIVDYIKTLYLFGMGIAGILAMAMIIVGGFQWMGGGSITSTRAAKSRVSNAVLGLVLLLAAYLILNTINPALVNLKEPYIYFIEWYRDFPDDGNTGTGGTGGGGGSDPCDDMDSCSEYNFYIDCVNDICSLGCTISECDILDSSDTFGCVQKNITSCSDYMFSISCQTDPCGVGGCSYDTNTKTCANN
jgi:hypothetical protein